MQRVASVSLPMWSIDLLRRRSRSAQQSGRSADRDGYTAASANAAAEAAIVLHSADHSREIVRHCCHRAWDLGIRPGMVLADARALMRERPLDCITHDPQRDRRALESLAQWAMRFSPIVAVDWQEHYAPGLLLNISGCDRVHGGERRLVNDIANRLEWMGITARVAIASTIGCAWGVSRFSTRERHVIPDGGELDAVDQLPIESLRLSDHIIEGLHELAIETVKQLRQLPRLEIAARFDAELLHRLDQVTGEAMETISPMTYTETITVDRIFSGPVKQIEAITRTAQELLQPLCDKLRQAESGVTLLQLSCQRIDADDIQQQIAFSRPTRNEQHIWTLLRPKIEQLHLGFGIEQVTLTALSIGGLPHRQQQGWSRDQDDDRSLRRSSAAGYARDHNNDDDGAACDQRAGEMLDTLISRLGEQAVTFARPMARSMPEHVARFEPALRQLHSEHGRRYSRFEGDTWRATWCHVTRHHPPLLFARPEPVEVLALSPSGMLSAFRWRQQEYYITAASGPQRLCPPWWTSFAEIWHGWKRDYYRIMDAAGRCLWLFRHLRNRRWFIHGEWT